MEPVSILQQSSAAMTPPPKIRGLIEIIEDIRHVFENYFDRTWFAVLIDDLPIDSRTIREIRNLVALRFFHIGDELTIREGIRELENFILCIRQFLLPVMRDKMGVSGFPNKKSSLDEHQKILRKFVLYAFPHNLETLAELTAELKEALYSSYPEIIHPDS
jgi:hypothetical protein